MMTNGSCNNILGERDLVFGLKFFTRWENGNGTHLQSLRITNFENMNCLFIMNGFIVEKRWAHQIINSNAPGAHSNEYCTQGR